MDSKYYKQIIDIVNFGYACHKMVYDKNGDPVDYIFLEVNKAFEKLTGHKAEKIINKRVTEVMPDIRKSGFDWITYFGEIVQSGEERLFEQYFEPLGRECKIHAFAVDKDHFVTMFLDVSYDYIISRVSKKFVSLTSENIDYCEIAKTMAKISGAKYVGLNRFDDNGKGFTTVAFSGISSHLKRAVNYLGYEIIGKKWDYDPVREEKISKSQTTTYNALHELTRSVISEKTVKLLEKMFNIGKTVIITTKTEGRILGDFSLMFEKGKQLANKSKAEAYADIVGMLFNRLDFEVDLKRQKDELDRFFEVNLDLLCIADTDGNFLRINKEWESVLGFSHEEIMQKKFLSFIHPEDYDSTLKAIVTLSHRQNVINFSNRFRAKDGHYRYIEWRSFPYGNLIYASARDITEKKEAEQMLLEKMNMLEILIRISSTYINIEINDVEGTINSSLQEMAEFVNADRAYIFDYNYEDQTSTNTHEWCAAGITSEIDNLQNISIDKMLPWIEVLQDGKPYAVDNVDDLDDENKRWLRENLVSQEIKSMFSFPMISNNSLIGFVGFDFVRSHHSFSDKEENILALFSNLLVNVNERIKSDRRIRDAKRQAEQANLAKSQFLANMSHEIRTPLNGVIGFTQLLQDTPLNDLQKQYLENADVSARSLLGIINDILDLSKIEAGKLELDLVRTNMPELLQQAADIIKYQAVVKKIEVKIDIQTDLPVYAVVDPVRLRQVLVNLLGNAVKFTNEGLVELKVHFEPIDKTKGNFSFEVHDTGIGIPFKHQEKIFETFSQADASTTRQFGGTGLGLTISKNLVTKMNGNIFFTSEPDKGTIFYFDIEAAYEKNSSVNNRDELFSGFKNWGEDANESYAVYEEDEKRSKLTDYDISNITVLIVDDVKSNMELAKALVLGIIKEVSIVEAYTGNEAYEKYIKYKPDIILMDVQMPDIDGVDLTKKIRKHEAEDKQKTPVIAVTAGVIGGERERCIKAGMDDFLPKPINKKDLKEVISKHLNDKLHFDETDLMGRTGLSQREMGEMISGALSYFQNYIESIEEAIKKSDVEKTTDIAHSIKGMALNMGFKYLASLAKKLESTTKENNKDYLSVFEEIKSEFAFLQKRYG